MINVEDYFGLVKYIYGTKYASKFRHLKDDLISEGYLGILDGIKAYNQHNHEYKIQTYIHRHIHKRMYKFILKELKHDDISLETLVDDDCLLSDTIESTDDRLDYITTTIDLENAMNNINKEDYKTLLHNYAQGYAIVDYQQHSHQNTQQKLKRAIKHLKENYINGTNK